MTQLFSELTFPENVEIDKSDVAHENLDFPLKNDMPDLQDTAENTQEQNKSQEEMIPVFSEWTQQQMQEAEKKLIELMNSNSTESNKEVKNETLAKHQIVKMRQKNYASPDCGAKVLASSPEAQSTSSVLTDKDEYLLSPCTDRIWFVVELCDSVQAQRVELANFELFSSPLKTVSISVSNRFPTRDWTVAGQFEAKSERDVQVLNLSSTLFGKFIRVDLTYTNTEHYCPLSFFRVFGTSEIEAFEVENEMVGKIDDEEDFEHHPKAEKPNKNNLFDRAGAAVMSIVQKAAEVLVKGNGNGTKANETSITAFSRDCMTLSHNILCQICSGAERDELNALISCKNVALSKLMDEITRKHLVNSVACSNVLGIDLRTENQDSSNSFVASILPSKYIAALCNMVATDLKILPLRIEDIPGINSSLVSKKDEISLKNISKKAEDPNLCKQDNFENPTTNLTNSSAEVTEEAAKTGNITLKGDESNIFNVVEKEKFENHPISSTPDTQEIAPEEVMEPKEEMKIGEEQRAEEVVRETLVDVVIESQEAVTPSPQVESTTSKPPQTEQYEVKINGDVRSSNPPESVFLRLSNRIKTLEKNMTLSTQYLEELSRRYKKQIEDVQQSSAKLQSTLEDQNQKKKESDKIDFEEKSELRGNTLELNKKIEYMEVVVIVLSVFFAVQTIFVVVLFKRISMLRNAFSAHNQHPALVPPPSPSQRATARKRSKQRTRKISAPNILTQRSPVKNEFVQPLPVLSRTVSAPNKFILRAPSPQPTENLDEMQVMLEENDDILIPGFSELKLNDEETISFDTASTASAKSSEKKENSSSNKSFKFKRRFSGSSSPFQMKKSSLKKASSEKNNQTWKKAMSESPHRIPQESHIGDIQKSKSFEENVDEGSVKFKKSNSFKKLFKKLF